MQIYIYICVYCMNVVNGGKHSSASIYVFSHQLWRDPLDVLLGHTFIHPSGHSSIHPSGHSYIQLLHPSICPVIHPTCWVIHSSIHLVILPPTQPFIHLDSSNQLAIHPFFKSCIHPAGYSSMQLTLHLCMQSISHSCNRLAIHPHIHPSFHRRSK